MHGLIIIKVNALDLGTCMIDLFGKQVLMHDRIPSTPIICIVPSLKVYALVQCMVQCMAQSFSK